MDTEQTPEQSRYLLDSESAAEMGRLLLQDGILTDGMGGIFPERSDLGSFHHILDVGCGPGGWAMRVARHYPHLRVTAIDISALDISFAQVQAQREAIQNVTFARMDALMPLAYPSEHFDMINVRLAGAWIPYPCWESFLLECRRTLKVGGTLRLVEIDQAGISNSSSFEQFSQMIARLYHEKAYGFSQTGLNFCITPVLKPLLKQTGFISTQHRPFVLPFNPEEPNYGSHIQNTLTAFEQFRPVWLKWGLATEEVLNRLKHNLQEDMQQSWFSSYCYGLIVWGSKPEEAREMRQTEPAMTVTVSV